MRNVKDRAINIDSLKVVGVLMIIAFHYVYHGRAGLNATSIIVRFVAEVVYHFGELGVSCFVLASGYFLEDTIFRPRKLVCLILQVEFYVVISKLILSALGQPTQWKILDFFPFLYGEYWFINVFLLIYILQPFLKRMVISLEQRQLWLLIISQAVIWSLIPTLIFSIFIKGSTEAMPYYNRYIWFLLVYLIGYYMRKYSFPLSKHDVLHLAETKRWIKILFPFALLILFIITGERGLWPYSATFFWTPNSLLMLIMSVALFAAFRDWKPKFDGRWVAFAAQNTLGIYLLHDGELRPYLWSMFPCDDSVGLVRYIAQLIVVVAFVVFIGVIIDTLRGLIEKKTIVPLIYLVDNRLIENKVVL